jgi:hypothetical protein
VSVPAIAATDYVGRVVFKTLPVPGATVSATHLDQRLTTVTDLDGVFRFPAIVEGDWTVRVEMIGFAEQSREITVTADTPASNWDLTLLPLADIARTAQAAPVDPAGPDVPPSSQPLLDRRGPGGGDSRPAPGDGFQRALVSPSAGSAAVVNDPSAAGDADRSGADGFLVNGSVNNGAASPFAQLAAFGNNRRNARSLYNGGIGVLFGNSALDARPFSFTGQPTSSPSYSDAQIVASFAGPLRIPRLVTRNAPNLFLGYQRTVDHNASTQSALMPTALERAGDFSQARDASGRPVAVLDTATRLPLPGHRNTQARRSPQAASQLRD